VRFKDVFGLWLGGYWYICTRFGHLEEFSLKERNFGASSSKDGEDCDQEGRRRGGSCFEVGFEEVARGLQQLCVGALAGVCPWDCSGTASFRDKEKPSALDGRRGFWDFG